MSGFRVDPHVKVLGPSVRRRARRLGLDALGYAPHFTPWPDIVDTARTHSDETLTVIPGREIFAGSWTDRTHVLAYDLEEPIPDFLSLEETMRRLRLQRAAVVVPHPAYLSISMSPGQIRRYSDQIDAIEVYNPRLLPWHPKRARRIATELDKPMVASSYAHLPTSVGAAWSELDEPLTDIGGLSQALKDHSITAVETRHLVARSAVSALELGHLCWENTGKKLWRRLHTHRVPTHPSAPTYHQRATDGSG